MYNVSDNYKTAVRALARMDDIQGTIKFKDGTRATIDTHNIDSGSVSINHQCLDGEELNFGSAILGQLEIGLRTKKDRYSFFEAEITANYIVKTAAGDEIVPLGVYTVAESDRTGEVVKLTAYDNLQKFDKPFRDTVLYGDVFSIFQTICRLCKVTMAFDEDYILSLPNGGTILQVDDASGCDTYRDILKLLCQLVGCFAQADRSGKLQVVKFNAASVTTLTQRDRYSLSLADYLCEYNGLVVNSSNNTYEVHSEDPKAPGMTMIISDAPSFDFGPEEVLQLRAQALFDYISNITYTPCSMSMPGDPSFDCGDRLTLVTNDGNVDTIITSITWQFRGQMSVDSSGANPYLASSKESTSKTSRIISQEIAQSKLAVYNFTNYEDIRIGDGRKSSIAQVEISTMAETSALFFATIILTAEPDSDVDIPIRVLKPDGSETTLKDSDGNVLTFKGKDGGTVTAKLTYTLDKELLDYEAIETYIEGDHVLSVYYPLTGLESKKAYDFEMFLEVDGGSIFIPMNTIKAVIMGQNMGIGSVEWDGKLEFTEDFTTIALSDLTLASLDDIMSVNTQAPIGSALSDTFVPLTLKSFRLGSIEDDVEQGEIIDFVITQQTVTFTNDFITTDPEGVTKLNTHYSLDYNSEEIDDGYLNSYNVNDGTFKSVVYIGKET